MKSYIYYISTLLVVAAFIFLFKKCENKRPVQQNNVQVTYDTIFKFDTVKIVKWYPKVKDSIRVKIDSSACSYERHYEDSIIYPEYDIFFKHDVKGILLNQDIEVRLKVPTIVTKIDIQKQEVKVPVETPKDHLYGLASFRIDEAKGLMGANIGLEYIHQTQYGFMYAYDFFNKAHTVGFSYKIK